MGTVLWELAMERPPWDNVKGEVHKKLIQLVAREGKRLSVPPDSVIPDGKLCLSVCVSVCLWMRLPRHCGRYVSIIMHPQATKLSTISLSTLIPRGRI
jgi:hypothetical protein